MKKYYNCISFPVEIKCRNLPKNSNQSHHHIDSNWKRAIWNLMANFEGTATAVYRVGVWQNRSREPLVGEASGMSCLSKCREFSITKPNMFNSDEHAIGPVSYWNEPYQYAMKNCCRQFNVLPKFSTENDFTKYGMCAVLFRIKKSVFGRDKKWNDFEFKGDLNFWH